MKMKTPILFLLTTALAAVPAFAQSSGTRGDPFHLVATPAGVPQDIQLPKFDEQQATDVVNQIRSLKPDPTIDPLKQWDVAKDQAAFDAIQASILARLNRVAADNDAIKEIFVQGAADFYAVEQGVIGDASKKHSIKGELLSTVAETFRSKMEEKYLDILATFNPSVPIGQFFYQVDGNHHVKAVFSVSMTESQDRTVIDQRKVHSFYRLEVKDFTYGRPDLSECPKELEFESTLGDMNTPLSQDSRAKLTSCGLSSIGAPTPWKEQGATFNDIAETCGSVNCVIAIQAVAQDMKDTSIKLQHKIHFKYGNLNKTEIFFDFHESVTRHALSEFINSELDNTDASLVGYTALRLTDFAWIPIGTVIDAVAALRIEHSTFDFSPEYWHHEDRSRTALIEQYEKIAEKLVLPTP